MTFSATKLAQEWAKTAGPRNPGGTVSVTVTAKAMLVRLHTTGLKPTDLRMIANAAEWASKEGRNMITGFAGTLSRYAFWSPEELGFTTPQRAEVQLEMMVSQGLVVAGTSVWIPLSQTAGKPGVMGDQDLDKFTAEANRVAAEHFKGFKIRVTRK